MKCICCILLMVACLAASPYRRVVDAHGDTTAVVVPENIELLYAPQALTNDFTPHITHEDVIKLNVVASTHQAAHDARQMVRNAFPAGQRPAVSVVIGSVANGKRLRMDMLLGKRLDNRRSRVFISGQAKKGSTPVEAAANTLDSLVETLEFAGCSAQDVLQARFFATSEVRPKELIPQLQRVFPKQPVALVWVEWKSELPMEIELVASGAPADADARVIEYPTPPGMTASPLFSRVVRVNRGDLIFIGDIYSKQAGDGESQVLSIFEQLQDVLKQTGSDLRHLVKATYYVSDDDASRKLNELRPRFYDPARPPAASKAMVPAVGMVDRSISIDMIAVPSTQPTREGASTRRAETGRR